MKTQQTHIAVGRADDVELLEDEIEAGNSIPWPVPSRADVGDVVLFLVPAQHGSIVATGTVLGKSVKSETWRGKYESDIGNLAKLNKPIAIEELKNALPAWGYPKYARGYNTVREEFRPALAAIVANAKRKRQSKIKS